jgi:GT2 family glycosyltransferase
MTPIVSIIILNWNGLEDTIECLESLKKITYPDYNVIVVDNASAGNDLEVIKQRFGDSIHIIENDKNYGYTGGNNIGIRYALEHTQPDYLLLLNNDIIVSPDFLTALVHAAKNDASIGIVGPKTCYYDFPDRIQSAGLKVSMWTGQSSHIGIKQIDNGQYNQRREVDSLMGCCLLIKNNVIKKIGMLDESYFCYWDETDYCARAREAGCKVMYVPQAKIWHKAAIKEKVWHKNPVTRKASSTMYYYMARNNFKFMRRHASRTQYFSFALHFFGWHLWFTTAACLFYYRDITRLLAFYRGTRDGILAPS